MSEVWFSSLDVFIIYVSLAGVMDVEVDILDFLVPVENNKTLFVWDIRSGPTEAEVYVSPAETT